MNKLSGKKNVVVAVMLLVVAVIGMILAMGRDTSSSSEEKLLQAQEYFDLLDYDKVVAIYNDIIAGDKTCTEAYVGLAEVYYLRGNSAKALEILERGLDNADEEAAIRNKMAELFSEDDIADIKQAEKDADDAMLTDISEEEEDIIIPAVENQPTETVPAETAAPDEVSAEPETVTTTAPPETTTTAAPAPVVTAPPAATTAQTVRTATAPPVTTTAATTTAKPKSVVPNFVGMTESEAKTAAKNNKLTLEINYEKGSAYPDGTVFRQSRNEGAKVEENTSVEIYICQFDKELQAFYNAANEWGTQNENVRSVTLNEKASSVTVSAGSMKKFVVDGTVMEAFSKCKGATLNISSADISISISSSSVKKTDKLDLSVNIYGNAARWTVEFGSAKDFGCSMYVTLKDCKIEDFSGMKLYRENKKLGAVSVNASNQPAFTVESNGTYVIK